MHKVISCAKNKTKKQRKKLPTTVVWSFEMQVLCLRQFWDLTEITGEKEPSVYIYISFELDFIFVIGNNQIKIHIYKYEIDSLQFDCLVRNRIKLSVWAYFPVWNADKRYYK